MISLPILSLLHFFFFSEKNPRRRNTDKNGVFSLLEKRSNLLRCGISSSEMSYYYWNKNLITTKLNNVQKQKQFKNRKQNRSKLINNNRHKSTQIYLIYLFSYIITKFYFCSLCLLSNIYYVFLYTFF